MEVSRQKSPAQRQRLAMDAIREASRIINGILCKVWGAIGLYTVCEVMHIAGNILFLAFKMLTDYQLNYGTLGLPPDITEAELVDIPDVMARLLLAYYQFACIGDTQLWHVLSLYISQFNQPNNTLREFVQRRLHGYMIAASESQRVGYTRFLHVWGKDRVHMTRRAGDAAERYSVWYSASLTRNI